MKIDPALITGHSFGQLAILLYAGRVMAMAIVAGDSHEHDDTKAETKGTRRKRNRARGAKPQISITWGTGFHEAI